MSAISSDLGFNLNKVIPTSSNEIDETTKKTANVANSTMKIITAAAFAITTAGIIAAQAISASLPMGSMIPASFIVAGVALAVLLIAVTDPEAFKGAPISEKNTDAELDNESTEDEKIEEKNTNKASNELQNPGEIHAPVGIRS